MRRVVFPGNVVKVIMLTLLMSLLSSFGYAEENDLKAAAKVLSEAFSAPKEASDRLELYKNAGITYQPELLTPLKDIADCKEQEKLRVLLGMYSFDFGYSRVFEKKKEAADIRMALQNDIVDRLEARDKLDKLPASPEQSKPEGLNAEESKKENLVKSWNLWVQDMIKKAEDDPQTMVLLMDMMYGASIEGLHVFCNLALNAEKSDALIELFNKRASKLEIMDAALNSLNDANLAAMVKKESRQKLARTVVDMVKSKKGALTREDILQILAMAEPERDLYVKKCQ